MDDLCAGYFSCCGMSRARGHAELCGRHFARLTPDEAEHPAQATAAVATPSIAADKDTTNV